MAIARIIIILFITSLIFCGCKTPKPAVQSSSPEVVPYHALLSEDDLDNLIREIGDATVVLLGESTHSTREFYQWRAAISQKLINEKGFNLIAIEGDWGDAGRVNDYLDRRSSYDSAISVLRTFQRWPSSMWGNYEMLPFVEWLRDTNSSRDEISKIRFYGLDLYAFWTWMNNFQNSDPEIQSTVDSARKFFSPFRNDAMVYGDWIRKGGRSGYLVISDLFKTFSRKFGDQKNENNFYFYQQAILAKNGEEYFRTMNTDRVKAINLRDTHMAETIVRILEHHGKKSKILVWLHNGHAGNVHYTVSAEAGYTSVAELLKNRMGNNKVFTVGFGTYKGKVLAGYQWNGNLIEQELRPAKTGSWEEMMHVLYPGNMMLFSRELQTIPRLNKWIEMRSVGAAYSGAAIYNRSIMPKRFDAFVFIDSTSAIRSLR